VKIALLSYEYPPDTGFGGVGTYTWYQARALVRQGHDVRVVAGSLEPGVFHTEHDGVRVTRVSDQGCLDGAIRGMHSDGVGWASVRVGNAMGSYLALRDLLEHERYDVVEYPECGADGTIVSTLLPVRTCVRFHSPVNLIMPFYGANEREIETATFVEQVAIDRAQLRISPSAFLAAEVSERLRVRPPVHVVPNGIDLDLFDRSEGIDVVERFGLPRRGHALTVLFTGRLERRKGVHLLPGICADVLAAHPQVHVVLAGADPDGAFASTIRPRVDQVGAADRIHHLSARSLPEVRALVKHADIHLHPSMWDNAPYSCIEAMAAGRPIVSSGVGGLPELVDHRRTGLVARAGDEGSFVDAIGELVEDPALRERLGQAARRAVEDRYTDTAMARRSVALWQALIAGTAPSHGALTP
jgi:starch synthase